MFRGLRGYEEYSLTGLPWARHLPSHWKIARGKTLFARMERPVRENDGVITCFRNGRVMLRTRRRTTGFTESLKEIGYQGIRRGDLVIHAMDAFAGAVGVAEDDGKSTPVYAVCIPNRDSLAHYYSSLIRHLATSGWIQANATGVRERSTEYRWNAFAEERLLLPPIEEQRAIVTYLAHAHQRINKAIAAKRRLIELLSEAQRSTIGDVMMHGLDPSVQMKSSGIAGLGEIPAHWEIRRVKDLCLAVVDCKNRTPLRVEGGGYSVIRTTCIKNGKFSTRGSYPTDRASYEEWTERGAPQAGDVFFTREAPAGEAAIVPNLPDLCMGQRMMYLRPTRDVSGDFLLHALYGPVTRHAIAIATNGSTVGHLRLGQVSALPVVFCPPDEQRQIVQRISAEVARFSHEESLLQREITLLEEFKTRLTSDVVTGQLDVREIAATLPPLDLAEAFAPAPGTVEEEGTDPDGIDADLQEDE